MITRKEFYEKHLKGKTAEEILELIRNLQEDMLYRKNSLENPFFEPLVNRREAGACVRRDRICIEWAKKALAETGTAYVPTEAEAFAADFDENIPYIRKIVFSIGGYFGGEETVTADLSGAEVKRTYEATFNYWHGTREDQAEHLGKDEFLAKIRKLHMGEWLKQYDTRRFGYGVCDGTQWEIEIEYSNGHEPVKFFGDNAYPYNFGSLAKLFDVRWNGR